MIRFVGKKFRILGSFFVIGVFLSLVFFGGRSANDVYLNNVLVSNFSRSDLSKVVGEYLFKLESRKVELGNVIVAIKDLGIEFDLDLTEKEILRERRYNYWQVLTARATDNNTYDNAVIVAPIVTYDPKVLQARINYIVKEFKQSPKEASLDWSEENGWFVDDGLIGREVADEDFITKQILQDLVKDATNLNSPTRYRIRYKKVYPEFTTAAAWSMLEKLKEQYLNSSVKVLSEGREVASLNMDGDPEWFEFDYKEKQIYVNQKKLEEEVENLAAEYESDLAKVKLIGIEEFESEYDGEVYLKAKLDGDLQKANMVDRAALKRDILAAHGQESVELKFHDRAVSIISDIEGMEFPDLISYGKSDYSLGAYANRVHNVRTATAFQDLTIIPQGSTYSFNRVGGWVTYAKGYKSGEVIFGTVAKYVAGGGVCQVSTTMYRAAVYAGLPIEARRNHSWDVSYYRDVYGVDAAVYPPGGLDLKFVNNTPGPILIHSYLDEDNKNVYFEMYGTSDGRSVSLGEPDITWLGGGAKKIVTAWKIVRAGGIVEEKEIVSRYSR